MSWFFGKKKHKESPPDSPVDNGGGDEGFLIVEKNDSDADNRPQNLYPALGNVTPYPPIPTLLGKQNSLESGGNELSNIPFKLCRELERDLNEDIVIDKLRLNEIILFINKVNVEDYNYEFNLERSVINEINSQNEE